MSLWLFNVYMDAVTEEVKMGMVRIRVRFMEEGRERRLPGLLYADDLFLCGESEEDLKAMMGLSVEVCRKRGLKVNAGKRKVMVMNGEEGLECEIHVDGVRLEHVFEFKFKEIYRIRAIQVDSLRDLLCIMMIDRFPNAQIRELG